MTPQDIIKLTADLSAFLYQHVDPNDSTAREHFNYVMETLYATEQMIRVDNDK